MYIVIRRENNLDAEAGEYGINDSYYLVGIFDDENRASRASKLFSGCVVVNCPKVNKVLLPFPSADEILDLPFDERHDKVDAWRNSGDYQPLIAQSIYIE